MISYKDSFNEIKDAGFDGFFVGWPSPPSPETFRKLLENSDYFVIAVDTATNRAIGFITCITDWVLTAYITLLEVLPEYQGRGIGAELVRRVFEKFDDIYKVELMCDEELQNYYAKLGMKKSLGMMILKYQHQSGRKAKDK
jgi:ribosomal protein S18 acetylase RimI-like enzyme